MLAALLLPFASQAQETVTIGEGTSTTYVTPFNSLWGYSFVEQIYLASEIGTDGNITAVRFYLSSGTQTNNITLYMKNVTRSTFSSSTDFESVSASDIVYTGSVTFTAGWVEIQLDTPFEYDGSSNLLVAMHEYTSGYSTLYFNYTEAADRVITFHSDSANPDPYNLGSYSGNKYTSANRANIQLDIEPAGEVSCYPVKNLAIVDSLTTTESLTLTWIDTNNTGATYTVYNMSDSTEVASSDITISDNMAVITGLNANTLYTFGVKVDCGNGDESNIRTVNGRTACDAVTEFPWEETFESYTSGNLTIPCWVNEHISGTGTSIFKVYTSSNGSNSTHQLQLPDMSNGTMTKLVLPYMELPEDSTYLFSIDIYRNTSSYPNEGVRVYASTNGEITGATELGFLHRNYQQTDGNVVTAETSSNWYTYEFIIPFNGPCYIILRGESSYGSSTYMDNLKVKKAPNCLKPTMLTASGITARTATLNWVPGNATDYQVEYRPTNDTTWIIETVSEDSTITLTGLTPETSYKARVKGMCSDEESEYTPEISFTTTVACFPPSNVRAELTSLYSTVNVAWTDTLAGTWELRYWTGTDTSDIIEVNDTTYTLEDLEENTNYRFQVRANCGDEDGYSVWTPANGRSFTTPLACEVPTELSAVLTPGNGTVATINWVDTVAAAWQVCFNGDTNNIIDLTETTISFDTLTPETTYTIKVRANCGDDVSPWSSSISFTPTNAYTYTVADGTNTNSYVPVYGFYADAYQRIQTVYPAASLATLVGSDITGLTYYLSSPASEAWTGTFTVKIMEVADATLSAFNTATDNEPVLYTGTLDASGATMTITLSQPYTYAGGNLLIEVNETVIGNYKSASFYGIDATGASQQGYNYSSWTGITGTARNFIPKTTFSFEPGVINDCTRPDSLTVSDVDAHSATFDWQGEASEYLLQYKQADATDWTEVPNVSAPYTLTGLQQNTAYTARVKAICGSDTSMASFAVSFTTTISCPAPTNIQTILTPGDGTVARVTWTDTVGTAWQICLVLDGDTSDIYDVTDTTAYDFTELTPEAIYTVMVRTICDEASDDISEWVHGTFNPTAKIVVGTPASTSDYLPTYSNYNYSLTQQIYTAAELGNTPGAIMSVDFMNGGTEKTRTIDVYMVSTTDSTISTFIPVTASDLVFSGTVTFTPNVWTSLVFDNPFIFDGSSNVLLVVDDNNGSYSYGLSCYTFNAPNQAIYDYDDDINYNPFAPSGYSGTVLNKKNHVRFLIGEPPACMPVGNLTINDSLTTANSITLTWSDTNAVNNYNIYIINGDNDSLIGNTTEMTYTITDLEATTAYTFGVAVNCGDEVSTMRTVSGRTDCEGGSCTITIQGHDTYSGADGWNGATISVIQAGETVGTFTVPYGNQHLTGTIQVCSGAPVSLSWTSGSYDSEAYFEILDGGGLEVYSVASGNGASIPDSVFFTITDPCPSCIGVSNLTVDDSSITSNSIAISWTGTADNYSIYIGETYVGTTTETSYTFTGLTPANNYNLGVRVICSDEDSSIIVYTNAATLCGVIDVFPYSQTFDGEPACWTKVDADGDGYNWEIVSGAIHSASYDNNYGALTPDNWLITPQFEFAAGTNYEVTWNANPQDASWPAEHYGLYVSTTDTAIASFTMIQDWTLTSAGHVPVVDLSNYSGQTVYLALRHWNCTDQFRIAIDNFEVREQAGDNQITVTLTQNNPMYGSVAGSGVYTIGDSVTVTATASASYIFNRWVDESGVTVSNDNPYTFVAATDVTLEAIFLSSSATTYTITVQVNDSTMGTAIGGGVYAAGDVAALSATANPGYSFVNWTQVSGYGENVVSTEPTFSITVTGDKTFVANFESDSASCTVYGDTTTATACDSYIWNGQTYTQSGTYFQTLTTAANCDSILTLILTINNSVAVTITDSAETSYTWNGQTYTQSGVYTWTGTNVAGCDSTVTLVLTIGGAQPTTYTVTVHYDATMGNVTGIPTGPVAAGTQVTLTANPLTGYHFMNWSTGDTTATITLTVNSDIDITANFEANQVEETYTVTVNYDATMGTVTGIPIAPVTAGTEVTLTATALPGFAFVNWSTGDTTATITITVTANIEITANFRSLDGIEDADMNNVSIFSANSTIYVKGAEGQNIYIYDLNGRTIATKLNATETMEIPMEQTGVYLVRVGNASAKRVIVMR